MAVVQTSVFALLKDTRETVWGMKYENAFAKNVYKKYMDEKTAEDFWVDDQEIVPSGLLARKEQGAMAKLDQVVQGFSVRYTNDTYALTLQISEEVVADNKYSKAVSWTDMAMESALMTPEYLSANILSRATNTSYTGGDGSVLAATNHALTGSSSTYSNRLATLAQLTQTSVEDLVTVIRRLPNSRGIIKGFAGKRLICVPNNEMTAYRILESQLTPDSANHAINAVREHSGLERAPVVVPFLTSTTFWGMKTTVPNGLTWYWRKKPELRQSDDSLAGLLNINISQRHSLGWTDPRGFALGNT